MYRYRSRAGQPYSIAHLAAAWDIALGLTSVLCFIDVYVIPEGLCGAAMGVKIIPLSFLCYTVSITAAAVEKR